ncbi:hypothetical protein PV326_004568 [Microctonus aethiopoides]|nr:hypothetical protein PV326_004568 [Microctonus aethiopoides]
MKITSKQFNDVAIQIQINHFIPKFPDFISNDSELSTSDGIRNFHLLKIIMKLVDKKIPTMSHSNAKLDLIEIIIMAFMKLKLNISCALLAVLFKSYYRALRPYIKSRLSQGSQFVPALADSGGLAQKTVYTVPPPCQRWRASATGASYWIRLRAGTH